MVDCRRISLIGTGKTHSVFLRELAMLIVTAEVSLGCIWHRLTSCVWRKTLLEPMKISHLLKIGCINTETVFAEEVSEVFIVRVCLACLHVLTAPHTFSRKADQFCLLVTHIFIAGTCFFHGLYKVCIPCVLIKVIICTSFLLE